MKLALFVHETVKEVGHSRAMIEVINHLPADEIEELHLISFEFGQIDELFPKLKDKIIIHKIPGARIYPFLCKMIFFYLATLPVLFRLPKSCRKITIGLAGLGADVVNIQFVHHQWTPYYFETVKLNPLAWVYKKLLFSCYEILESLYYRSSKRKFVCLSRFVTEYMQCKFDIHEKNLKTIYSGVNTDEFYPLACERSKLFEELLESYPALKQIDPDKPILLFVGAFERKGLPRILEEMENFNDSQLIVIGKPESHAGFKFPDLKNIVHIEFTRELNKFYNLCDEFLFPTKYEPFGLVIIEAAASGMLLTTTRKDVGATEILEGLPGIKVYDDPGQFKISSPTLLSKVDRNYFVSARNAAISKYTWEAAGKEFWEFIS